MAVTRRLVLGCPPAHADVWIVRNLNPDGVARGTRLNGRGVDLNRNFPAGWRRSGRRWDAEYSGPRPLSEPETRAARKLVRFVRPKITIFGLSGGQAQRSAAAIGRLAGYVGENRRHSKGPLRGSRS
jgi:hypothetical protein